MGALDVVRSSAAPAPVREPEHPDGPSKSTGRNEGERWIALLTTSGPIASRVDYRTGEVRPVKTERETLNFFPDLERDGPVRLVPVSDRLSEEIVPADWMELAKQIVRVFGEGPKVS